ncbi:hypothetical protein GCM10017790_12080 [Amycolatopsis oliviviridis]|uniref:Uncharacterized protein n=1 Tax=Amycolatopsis oliviviridis TaxID=1471590 RepID=A0ABQ3L6X7_9PSEU|nr:hypothetical protein GCM10017790_12080 [Amycolatopsis oliviviridis]
MSLPGRRSVKASFTPGCAVLMGNGGSKVLRKPLSQPSTLRKWLSQHLLRGHAPVADADQRRDVDLAVKASFPTLKVGKEAFTDLARDRTSSPYASTIRIVAHDHLRQARSQFFPLR